MQHEFTINFGDLKIQQHTGLSERVWVSGQLHRLTPEQFDAMTNSFEVVCPEKTLTTDDRYGAPLTFRTAEIMLGGLKLSIFADVS
jgi:hypothetical protein